MSERFGGFGNKFMMLMNPLPAVTFEDLHNKAGVRLRNRRQAKVPVFTLDLQYGGGAESESMSLPPGKQIRVDENFGRQVIEDFKPSAGMCAREPGLAFFKDDSERHEAMIQALATAESHYHICGATQLDNVRALLGHRDDEVERLRNSRYATYFLAIAKEELIREAREALESKGQKKAS